MEQGPIAGICPPQNCAASPKKLGAIVPRSGSDCAVCCVQLSDVRVRSCNNTLDAVCDEHGVATFICVMMAPNAQILRVQYNRGKARVVVEPGSTVENLFIEVFPVLCGHGIVFWAMVSMHRRHVPREPHGRSLV